VASIAACAARSAPPARPPAPPLGSIHVVGARVGAPAAAVGDDEARDAVPPAVARAADAVAQLSDEGHPSHAGIVRALRALADAGAQVAPSRTAELEAMRNAAAELATSPHHARNHVEMTLHGLEGAIRMFASVMPADAMVRADYAESVRVLGVAIDAIDPRRPLLAQKPAVVAAFRAAIDTLFLAFGLTTSAR
jgi:hypothetical protein